MKKILPHRKVYLSWETILFVGLILILMFILVVRPPWDPDLGWHLKNGEDILRFGVPRGDIYSHTMPGYPWISHEWLTDVLMYLSQRYFGFAFLSFAFALIAAGAYWLAARVSRACLTAAAISALIAVVVAYPTVGVRPQVLTLLGLAITLAVLFRWREKGGGLLLYWMVPLMLIWANLHGGFTAGILLLGIFGVVELAKYLARRFAWRGWQLRALPAKEIWRLWWVGMASVAVTLINPYTWRVYDELFRTVFNDLVRSGIAEWLPVTFNNASGINLLIYTGFLLLFVALTWRKVDPTKLVIGIIFFLVAISSWRHLPLFPLVTLPLLAESIGQLLPEEVSRYAPAGWLLIIIAIISGYLGYHQYRSLYLPMVNQQALAEAARWPAGAVQYLKEHPGPGKLFNEYNWGGYLIWQYPEKKVFIDGRMAIWRASGQDIFREYQSLSAGNEVITTTFDKYRVGSVLVYQGGPVANYLLQHEDEWELVYRDALSALFYHISPLAKDEA